MKTVLRCGKEKSSRIACDGWHPTIESLRLYIIFSQWLLAGVHGSTCTDDDYGFTIVHGTWEWFYHQGPPGYVVIIVMLWHRFDALLSF